MLGVYIVNLNIDSVKVSSDNKLFCFSKLQGKNLATYAGSYNQINEKQQKDSTKTFIGQTWWHNARQFTLARVTYYAFMDTYYKVMRYKFKDLSISRGINTGFEASVGGKNPPFARGNKEHEVFLRNAPRYRWTCGERGLPLRGRSRSPSLSACLACLSASPCCSCRSECSVRPVGSIAS